MYDRGSNVHLATKRVTAGKIAEKVSRNQMKIAVAGGKTKTYTQGMYRVSVDESESIHCHPVQSIARYLRRQDLQEVNTELQCSGLIDPSLPLPDYTAGGDVQVLVGLQDVRLDPILIAVLPSGIGVYRCPFKDIWGSQIAYAGPHPSSYTADDYYGSTFFVNVGRKPDLQPRRNNSTRESCRNPDLCLPAPPGWGGAALSTDRHRPRQHSIITQTCSGL